MPRTLVPRRHLLLAAAANGFMGPLPLHASTPEDPSDAPAECVVPAKAGGGFDLTCTLARDALQAVRPVRPPLVQRYLPGGIGAMAFDRVATGLLGGAGTLVAFSSGSLLNLAQGRFGPHTVASVRWIAILGTDYGAVAVHRDSPWRTLRDLVTALAANPGALTFGAGGTVGSQDWVKAALLTRAAGRDHRSMRFVSFEGGGDALVALSGRHVDVFSGDAAEALQAQSLGMPLRFLTVLAPGRLDGALASIPTAREQGVDLVWPTVRGLYVSAKVPDSAVQAWSAAFRQAGSSPGFTVLLAQHGLYPPVLTGDPLQAFIKNELERYRQLAESLGLRRWQNSDGSGSPR